MPTKPRILNIHPKSKEKLIFCKREAEQTGEYRVAKRIHAVLLNHQEKTSTQISEILHVSRSRVSEWLKNYENYGYEALLEGHRSGRHSQLSTKQQSKLCQIIDNGPLAYGFTSGIWTSIMISEIIQEEFLIKYHPGHVRKLLQKMGYSMQKPKRVLARADPDEKARWRRYVYPNIKKKPAHQVQQ